MLNIFGIKDGQEVDALIWRMKPFKKIYDVSLMNKQQADEEEFEEDGSFNNYRALLSFEGF